MKRLALCLLILPACLARAEQYTLSHTATSHVYDKSGAVFDASIMHGEIQFTLTDGKRICADPRTMKLQAQDGSKMLQMEPEVRDVFSDGPADPGNIPPTNLDLADGKTIRWSIGDQTGSGVDWTEVDRQICLKYPNKQLVLAATMPGSWLLTKTPFVFHVDQGLKIGDEVTIPFRRPLNPKGPFGSTDRTDKLTCISLDNDIAILTSNLTRNSQSMLITWHVRVEFDMKKQRMLRAVEEHLNRQDSDDYTNVTLTVVRCQIEPEEVPQWWPETRRIWASDLPVRTRIERIVQFVEKEPPEVGLQRLDEYFMYRFWVTFDEELLGGRPFPLKPALDQEEIVRVLANRRFVRLVEVFEQLPKDRAAGLVGDELGRTLAQYNELWQEEMKDVEFLKKAEYRKAGSHTRDFILVREDGKPTIPALRFKILALLLLAGDLQLESADEPVAAAADMALRQREEFYGNPAYDPSSAAPMLTEMSLYHRPALATALLRTGVSPERQSEILLQSNAELKTVRLREHIEMTNFRGDCFGIRLPDERLEVKHVGLITDEQFDRIVAEVKKVRVQRLSHSARDRDFDATRSKDPQRATSPRS